MYMFIYYKTDKSFQQKSKAKDNRLVNLREKIKLTNMSSKYLSGKVYACVFYTSGIGYI